ncbi:MAG: hypothetical protein ACM3O7_01735 [Acidobacteriota bacterium]
MKHEGTPGDHPFAGLEPPYAPPALEALALRSTREALARPVASEAWVRVWESRPLRLAWAATVSVLVVANVLVAPSRPADPRVPALTSAAQAAHGRTGELGGVLGLTPLDGSVLSLIGAVGERLSSPPLPTDPAAKAKPRKDDHT